MRCSVATLAAATSSIVTVSASSGKGPAETRGESGLREPLELVRTGFQADRDDAVEAPTGEGMIEHAGPVGAALGRAVQAQVEAVRDQRMLDAEQDLGEEPAVHHGMMTPIVEVRPVARLEALECAEYASSRAARTTRWRVSADT